MGNLRESPEFLAAWDVMGATDFIKKRNFTKICLQFPDDLLHSMFEVQAAYKIALRDHPGAQVYVLADSSYHSLGVDEVAAAHVKADCVVHYGYASLEPVATTTTYFAFPRQQHLQVDEVAKQLCQYGERCDAPKVLVFPDQTLHIHLEQLEAAVRELQSVQGGEKLVFAHAAALYLDPPVKAQPSAKSQGAASSSRAACCGTTQAPQPTAAAPSSTASLDALAAAASAGCGKAGCCATAPPPPPAAAAPGSTASLDALVAAASAGCGKAGCCATAPPPQPAAAAAPSSAASLEALAATATSALSGLQLGPGRPDEACCMRADAAGGSAPAEQRCNVQGTSQVQDLQQQQQQQQQQQREQQQDQQDQDLQQQQQQQQDQQQDQQDEDLQQQQQQQQQQQRSQQHSQQQQGEEHAADAGAGCCSKLSSSEASESQPVERLVPTSVLARQASEMDKDRRGCHSSSEDTPEVQEQGKRLLAWRLPQDAVLEDMACVWLGPSDSPLLQSLQLTLNHLPWSSLDSTTCCWTEGLQPHVAALLKRRHYLVEKTRTVHIVGLLIGTLGIAACLPALERLRDLAHKAGKKTYTILMGKPAPQKLANFAEVEVFVQLADPQGIILDSKEYFAPIVTPYEAYLAFTGRPWEGRYRLDIDFLLEDTTEQNEAGLPEDSSALALVGGAELTQQSNNGKEVVVKSAAQFLSKRSWKGLESPLTGAEPKEAELATEGLRGRAAVYSHETR